MNPASMAQNFNSLLQQYDVIITPAWWQILDAAQAGNVVDLSSYFNTADYMVGVFDRVTVNGKIYAAPGAGYPVLFYYRKSFFSAHGLSIPQDLNSFFNLLDQLKDIKIRGIQQEVNEIISDLYRRGQCQNVTVCEDLRKTLLQEIHQAGLDKVIIMDSGFGRGYPQAMLIDAALANLGGYQLHRDVAWGKINFTQAANQINLADVLKRIANYTTLMNITIAYKYFWNETYYLTFRPNCAPSFIINFGNITESEVAQDIGAFAFPGNGEKVAPTEDISYAAVSSKSKHINEAIQFVKFYSTKGGEIMSGNERLEAIIPMYKNANLSNIWAPARATYQYVRDNNVRITFTLVDDTFTIPQVGVHWIGAYNVFTNPNSVNSYIANMTQVQPYYPVHVTADVRFFNWAVPAATQELYQLYYNALKEK